MFVSGAKASKPEIDVKGCAPETGEKIKNALQRVKRFQRLWSQNLKGNFSARREPLPPDLGSR